MRWLISFFAVCVFAQFETPTITSIDVDADLATLHWDVVTTSNFNATSFRWYVQHTSNSNFDPSQGLVENDIFQLSNGNTLISQRQYKLPAGTHRFRISIILVDGSQWTPWSGERSATIAAGLTTPTLTLNSDSGLIRSESVTMQIGHTPPDGTFATYSILYGTKPELQTNGNPNVGVSVDTGIDPSWHSVLLAGVFEPGTTVFFQAQALLQTGEDRYSTVQWVLYQPITEVVQYVPHVANVPGIVETSVFFENREANKFVRLIMKAKTSGGIFDPGSPQEATVVLGPGESYWVKTADIFEIHRRPMIFTSDGSVLVKVGYRTWFGDSEAFADLPSAKSAKKSIRISNIEGKEGKLLPGVVVSNVTENDGSATLTFTLHDQYNNIPSMRFGPVAIPLPAFESAVRDFFDLFGELPSQYSGVLRVESTVPCVAIASSASTHVFSENNIVFNTLTFISQD